MLIALAHDHYDTEHLAEVAAEMATLGAPVIRAVNLGEGRWQALEGSHRLRAAHAAGIAPELVEVEYSDEPLNEIDEQWDPHHTVASLCDDSHKATWLEW